MANTEKNVAVPAETEVLEAEVLDARNVVELTKPVDGKERIVLDFDKLTGGTLIKCATEAKKTDPAIIQFELSKTYQAHVAAAAAGLRYDDILGLAAPDFVAVTLRVQNFLFGNVAG